MKKPLRTRHARWSILRILFSIRSGCTSIVLPATRTVRLDFPVKALDGAPDFRSRRRLFGLIWLDLARERKKSNLVFNLLSSSRVRGEDAGVVLILIVPLFDLSLFLSSFA